jgi:hypothetical protein
MVEDRSLLRDAESFEALMARCFDVAARSNREADREQGGKVAGRVFVGAT